MSSVEPKPDPSSYASLLLACCTVTFVCYFGSYMRMPVVPIFARAMGADTAQVGVINSTFLLVAGLLSLPFGILSDRLGRKLLILSGLFISALSSVLLYVSTSTTHLIGIYLLYGLGLAAFAPTMMSFITDFSPRTHLGRSYGWYTMALYGGMSLGPAAGGFMAQTSGFRPTFLASGVLIFLVLGLAWLLLSRVHADFTQKPGQLSHWPILRQELAENSSLWACWLATLGGCFGLGMFITFIPLHAYERGLSMGEIGAVFTVQGLSNAFSRLPFGHLGDRLSERTRLVILGLLGLALTMALFGIAGNFIQFSACAVLLGLSMGLSFTAIGALIAEVVPPQARGLAMGGYNTCIYLGMMLSSMLMGFVASALGFKKVFLITGGFVALTVTGFFWLVHRPSGHKG